MAYVISDACISCGACEGTCPAGAISEGADLHSIQCSCISDIFPVVCDQHRIIKILCNLYTSFRISRKDHITAHFTFCHLNMILSVYIFWVIFHNHPILFVFTWNIGCHCLTILLLMHLRQFNRISCSDELNQYTLFTRITIVSSFYYDYKSYTCMRKVLF